MDSRLFDVMVAAIESGTSDNTNLSMILLDEVYDLDEDITERDAEKLVDVFITHNYVDAEAIAYQLNAEATAYLYERELATRGW